jgi:hypothetical protein
MQAIYQTMLNWLFLTLGIGHRSKQLVSEPKKGFFNFSQKLKWSKHVLNIPLWRRDQDEHNDENDVRKKFGVSHMLYHAPLIIMSFVFFTW